MINTREIWNNQSLSGGNEVEAYEIQIERKSTLYFKNNYWEFK
jgi:hypothetical protein